MLTITCKKKFSEAVELSRKHYDTTLSACMMRLLMYSAWEDVQEVRLRSDFCEHSFCFAVIRKDGSVYFNGGVIFHGFPDEGYKQNGSVQISPSYGWQIHT